MVFMETSSIFPPQKKPKEEALAAVCHPGLKTDANIRRVAGLDEIGVL